MLSKSITIWLELQVPISSLKTGLYAGKPVGKPDPRKLRLDVIEKAFKLRDQTLASFVFLITLFGYSCSTEQKTNREVFNSDDMLVRIAEIEIDANYLEEYVSILKEEAEASVRLEPGVICIFPMFQKENPTRIRLLEIYADQDAYKAHLQTPHFKHYKTTTLNMVRSLELIDMEAIDAETMSAIFTKLEQQKK